MYRPPRLLLVLALVAFGSAARGEALRLVTPAPGATLRGGSVTELQWAAGELPEGAAEWEGFLSVNGGEHYAFRVTPHLDIELQTVTFVVPNVDTHDARILIRAGDEERETGFEQQGSFSIVRDPHAPAVEPGMLHHGRGEAAREGEEEVVAWAEGPRSGADVRQQVAPVRPVPVAHLPASIGSHDETAGLASGIIHLAAPSMAAARRVAQSAHARRAETHLPVAVDLLLVCRRRNI